MKTHTIRVWEGVYEAVQIYAKSQKMDGSVVASLQLMMSLFGQKELPQDAKTALARDFFMVLGEGILENKEALARWASSGFGEVPNITKKGA